MQLITILIGQTDLCRLTCRTNSSSNRIQTARKFAKNVKKAVDKLYREVPRALVNIVLPAGRLKQTFLTIFSRPNMFSYYCNNLNKTQVHKQVHL